MGTLSLVIRKETTPELASESCRSLQRSINEDSSSGTRTTCEISNSVDFSLIARSRFLFHRGLTIYLDRLPKLVASVHRRSNNVIQLLYHYTGWLNIVDDTSSTDARIHGDRFLNARGIENAICIRAARNASNHRGTSN